MRTATERTEDEIADDLWRWSVKRMEARKLLRRSVATAIQEQMSQEEVTVDQLANKLEWSVRKVRRILDCDISPSLDDLSDIAHVLGVRLIVRDRRSHG